MSTAGASTESVSEIGDYIDVLRRRRTLILLVTLLFVAAALAQVAMRQSTYQATASILISPTLVDPFNENRSFEDLVSLETERAIIKSAAVAALANQGRMASQENFVQRDLIVSNPPGTEILEATYSATEPIASQQGANAFARGYLEFKGAEAAEAIESKRARAEDRLEVLEATLVDVLRQLDSAAPGSSERFTADARQRVLTNQIAGERNQVDNYARLSVDPGRIIEQAARPSSPAGTSPVINLMVGTFFGFLVGIVIAFVRDRLDNHLHDAAGVEAAIGAPVLATVPGGGHRNELALSEPVALIQPNNSVADAYRRLSTGVTVVVDRLSTRVILVTSAAERAAVPETAANLAVALARTTKEVALILANLRHPRLHQTLGITNETGLSDFLLGTASVQDVVQVHPYISNLSVITSGPVSEQAGELLQGDRLRSLLTEQSSAHDIVVVEAPPTLVHSDAVALASRVDGILLVATVGGSSEAELTEARRQLEQVGGVIVGCVIHQGDGLGDDDDMKDPSASRRPIGGSRRWPGVRGRPRRAKRMLDVEPEPARTS